LSEQSTLSNPEDVWLHITKPYIYRVFFNNLLQIKECHYGNVPLNSSFSRTLIKLMDLFYKYYPSAHDYKRPWNSSDYPRGAVEEELILCQKSAYLVESNQLEFKYMSDNYKKKRFYYLRDGFTAKRSVWEFRNLQKSRLPFYFSMFLQSGVYHQLHKLKLFKDHLKRRYVTTEIIKRTDKREALDMKSSIQTIFILFLAISLLAKIMFVAEHCYSAFPKLVSSIKHFKCKIRVLLRHLNNLC